MKVVSKTCHAAICILSVTYDLLYIYSNSSSLVSGAVFLKIEQMIIASQNIDTLFI